MKAFIGYHFVMNSSMRPGIAIAILIAVFSLLPALSFADTAVYTASANSSMDNFGYLPDPNQLYLGSPFTAASAGDLSSVDISLCVNGSPSLLALAVYTDSGGSPGSLIETSSNTIGSSDMATCSSISSDGVLATVVTFYFTSTSLLSSGGSYWIVVYPVSPSGSDYYSVAHSLTGADAWRGQSASDWTQPHYLDPIAYTVFVSLGAGGGNPIATSSQATTSLAVLNANMSFIVDFLILIAAIMLTYFISWFVLH